MLRSTNISRVVLKLKLKNWFCILPTMFMLINIFSPAISLVIFHQYFDQLLVECQQNRHHDKDCHASSLREEMMPAQKEAIPEKTVAFINFFPDLFFKEYQFASIGYVKETLITNLCSNHLMLYSSPALRIQIPPPKQ